MLVLIAGGLGPAELAAQPSGEAWIAVARSYLSSPERDATLGGISAGFGIGSPTLTFGPEILIRSADSLRVRGFAIGVRVRQRSQYLQPHLVGTVGIYAWQRAEPLVAVPGAKRWEEVEYLTASLGAGVSVGTWRGRLSGLLEGRWHRNIASDPAHGSRSLIGVDAGVRVAW